MGSSNVRQKLGQIVELALEELSFAQPFGEFEVEHPSDESHGDYSSNVALKLFPEVQGISGSGVSTYKVDEPNTMQYSSPRELAEKLVESILKQIQDDKDKFGFVMKVEVAGPGFVNFYLSEHFLKSELRLVSEKKGEYGKKANETQRKVMVEFTDPNPFKEFHIGHLYSNIVGESLSRLNEAVGNEVKRACYQGDVGMHVAKSLWGLQKKMDEDGVDMGALGEWELGKRVEYMGQAYALGASKYKDDDEAKREMEEINKKIYAKDEAIMELYEVGRKWSLEYFEEIYQRLGTKFDYYFFESEVGESGKNLVLENLEKGVFEEGEGGAIVYKGEKKGLHTRVFVNALGLPTYEAKDLRLAPAKFTKYEYDKSIIVTGNEIDEYFKVIMAVLEEISPELRAKTEHVSHGMVKLPEGKMSSRTGKILKGEWLLGEAKKKVLEVMNKAEEEKKQDTTNKMQTSSKKQITNEEKGQVAEQVGQGAVKFALLKSSVGRDVVFDFEESVSFEGNSGPYVQYTYARCLSVLRKANDQFQNSNAKSNSNDQSSKSQKDSSEVLSAIQERLGQLGEFDMEIQVNEQERAVLAWLYRFGEVVERAAEEMAPHHVCTYLFELGQRFNTFYNQDSILDSGERKSFRLALTAGVAQVLENGLGLLGIGAPREM